MRNAMMYRHLLSPLRVVMIYAIEPVKTICMITVVRFLPIARPIDGSEIR